MKPDSLSSAEFESTVIDIVKEAMESETQDDITLETSFIGDLDVDSLTLVRIDMLTQAKLGLALAADDIEAIETIGDLVVALRERGQPV